MVFGPVYMSGGKSEFHTRTKHIIGIRGLYQPLVDQVSSASYLVCLFIQSSLSAAAVCNALSLKVASFDLPYLDGFRSSKLFLVKESSRRNFDLN